MIKIAAFDFDGTITTRNTLWEFLKFSQSRCHLFCGLFLLSPVLVLYKTGVISNHNAKEILFSYFFKGWNISSFGDVCNRFSSRIDQILNPETMKFLESHKSQQHLMYIVSASVENWIIPWAKRYGITVLATQIELDSTGHLTGRFKTKNCYGQAKVSRLRETVPDRATYYLFAYGDSRGDREMLAFADEGVFIK